MHCCVFVDMVPTRCLHDHDAITIVTTHEFHMQLIVANKETVDTFAIACMVQNHLTPRPMSWCEGYDLVA